MSFGAEHYVPVLKVKRGEKRALQLVAPSIRSRITPLLEIVERRADKAPTVGAHLDTTFKDLAESVQPYARVFLDTRETAADGPEAAAAVFDRATAAGISFTPVTGISRTEDLQPALLHRGSGLALRLSRSEFEAGGLREAVYAFMAAHGLVAEAIDLIVDLGSIEDLIADGVRSLSQAFLDEVPDHGQWRTLTVSASAFPLSMGVVDRRSHRLVERTEWCAWRDYLYADGHTMQRVPTFSDCAIQHPSGVEGFDPRTMQVSASIRYTLPDEWLLIKGESTRIRSAGLQLPELATQLVFGQFRPQFAGPSHCAGCDGMRLAAVGMQGFGSPEVWRRLGTIHHITRVVEDLAALPAT